MAGNRLDVIYETQHPRIICSRNRLSSSGLIRLPITRFRSTPWRRV